MPRKIRQLRAELRLGGFEELAGRGKGSHRVFGHRLIPTQLTISGADGDDAKPYQEKAVRAALAALAAAESAESE